MIGGGLKQDQMTTVSKIMSLERGPSYADMIGHDIAMLILREPFDLKNGASVVNLHPKAGFTPKGIFYVVISVCPIKFATWVMLKAWVRCKQR